jgi:hypothetical protein
MLEDTVEFFNLFHGLKLTEQEKQDSVAFVRALQAPGGRRRSQDAVGMSPGSFRALLY